MSHRPRIPEGANPFLTERDLKQQGQSWRQISSEYEGHKKKIRRPNTGGLYSYTADRHENEGKESEKIQNIHDESFIHKVIPEMLKLKKSGKLKVLDNGAGVGLFAEQIRQEFGDQVEVYSTGLSKKTVKTYRTKNNLQQLHDNDLKWRSIAELSDFPEFDLIVDTFGEQYYRPEREKGHIELSSDGFLKRWQLHIEQVIKKLLPGGYASLGPVNHYQSYSFEMKEIMEKLKITSHIDYNFDVNTLKIRKI